MYPFPCILPETIYSLLQEKSAERQLCAEVRVYLGLSLSPGLKSANCRKTPRVFCSPVCSRTFPFTRPPHRRQHSGLYWGQVLACPPPGRRTAAHVNPCPHNRCQLGEDGRGLTLFFGFWRPNSSFAACFWISGSYFLGPLMYKAVEELACW